MKLKQKWVFAWAAVRLPLLALAIYLFRYQIVEWFEGAIGFTGRMDFFVFTVSTLSARLILLLACSSALGFWYWLTAKLTLSMGVRYILWMAGAVVGIFISLHFVFLTTDALIRTAGISLLLAVNTLPHEWLAKRLVPGAGANLVFLSGVGVVEALFPQAYFTWLTSHNQEGNPSRSRTWIIGILVAALFWVFLFVPYDNQRVFTLTERLYADPAVQKFAPGIYNWVELNPKHDLLYVVGRGTNFLLAFDANNLNSPPRRSKEDIGKTQSFGFNSDLQEIYVYKAASKELLYMDAVTLEVLKAVAVPDLSPGDVWVRWLYLNDTIILSSESDAEVGTPLYVFDRESGGIIASLPFPIYPTEFAFHSQKPLMYFSSFKATYFAVWDLEKYEITKQVEIPPRTDRMIFSEKTYEIWLAAPLSGEILHYDADTLENTGNIKGRIGDRTLTIDTKRNLLLVGNFLTGRLSIIDLATDELIANYYLAPWIRTIALDMENGIAYVSTVRGLFKVHYASTIK